MRCSGLGQEEGALDVRVVVPVIVRLRHVCWALHVHDARVEHHDVKLAELAQGLVYETLVVCDSGDVRLHDDGLAGTLRVDGVRDALSSGRSRDIVDHDIRTLRGEFGGNGRADRTRRASDDGDLSGERERHRGVGETEKVWKGAVRCRRWCCLEDDAPSWP